MELDGTIRDCHANEWRNCLESTQNCSDRCCCQPHWARPAKKNGRKQQQPSQVSHSVTAAHAKHHNKLRFRLLRKECFVQIQALQNSCHLHQSHDQKKLELEQLADKKTSSLTRLVFAMSADMMWSCTFNRCWGKQSWKYHVHQSSVHLNKVFCVFIGNDVVGTHRTCEPKNDHKQNEELWLVKMPSRLDVSGQLRCCNKFY